MRNLRLKVLKQTNRLADKKLREMHQQVPKELT
jgi:hypothetical protein